MRTTFLANRRRKSPGVPERQLVHFCFGRLSELWVRLPRGTTRRLTSPVRLAVLLSLWLVGPALAAPEWLTDYEAARVKARQEHKPLLVVFR